MGLFSLICVALLGSLMRYKIAFDFPFFVQKNILHAHSHVAFTGWVSHILYIGILTIILPYLNTNRQRIYRIVIDLNFLCAMGMLVSFFTQGYSALSITFSTISIFTALAFTILFIIDSKKLAQINHPSRPWAIVALLMNVISAAGPFTLAYMMMNKNIHHNLNLASVYYYLHFQYNGWFFFGVTALGINVYKNELPSLKKYFYVFALAVIPTFVLSVLWTKPPMWLYIITVILAIAQLIAWVLMLFKLYPLLKKTISQYPKWVDLFFVASTFALTIKFILQAISVIPSLSQLVFGFRPIIIGYLHLVLLGVYSLFIIGFSFVMNYFKINKLAKYAALSFFVGVVLNESFLAVQGFAAFTYTLIPHINELLLFAALVLFVSATSLFASQLKK